MFEKYPFRQHAKMADVTSSYPDRATMTADEAVAVINSAGLSADWLAPDGYISEGGWATQNGVTFTWGPPQSHTFYAVVIADGGRRYITSSTVPVPVGTVTGGLCIDTGASVTGPVVSCTLTVRKDYAHADARHEASRKIQFADVTRIARRFDEKRESTLIILLDKDGKALCDVYPENVPHARLYSALLTLCRDLQ